MKITILGKECSNGDKVLITYYMNNKSLHIMGFMFTDEDNQDYIIVKNEDSLETVRIDIYHIIEIINIKTNVNYYEKRLFEHLLKDNVNGCLFGTFVAPDGKHVDIKKVLDKVREW